MKAALASAIAQTLPASRFAEAQQNILDAAARAVLLALQSGGGMRGVGLEGTSVVQAHGKTYVLVSARLVNGRYSRTLTGIASLSRSPEEAAIFAALQATNRLAEI